MVGIRKISQLITTSLRKPREIHQALRHCARANEDRWPATPCRGRRAPLSPAPVNLTGAFAGTGLTRSTSPRLRATSSSNRASSFLLRQEFSPRSFFVFANVSICTYRVFHSLLFQRVSLIARLFYFPLCFSPDTRAVTLSWWAERIIYYR